MAIVGRLQNGGSRNCGRLTVHGHREQQRKRRPRKNGMPRVSVCSVHCLCLVNRNYAVGIVPAPIRSRGEPFPFELTASAPVLTGGRRALASSSASAAPRLRQAISLVQNRRSIC